MSGPEARYQGERHFEPKSMPYAGTILAPCFPATISPLKLWMTHFWEKVSGLTSFWGKMSGPVARYQEARQFEPKTMPCTGTAELAPRFPTIATSLWK